MIKHLFRAAAACAVLGAGSAYADTFDFSYTFADGQQVTGDFTGTTTNGGQSVTNIANIQMVLNGIGMAPVVVNGVTLGAALQANNWNATTGAFDSAPVTVYANGALNNFIFADVDSSTSSAADYEFAYINDPNIFEVVAANFLQSDAFSTAAGNATQLAIDSPTAASWKLTDLTPVPVPASIWLLAPGVGLFFLRSRRRNAGALSPNAATFGIH